MKRVIMLRSGWFALAVAVGGTGCDETAPDGTGLVVEVLAEQPLSTDLGVSLAVHARGGAGVYLSLEQGTFLIDLAGGDHPPAAQTRGCIPGGAAQEPFSFALSVRPATAEALLFATLYVGRDCSGETLQGRLLAIRPPSANPVPQDAGALTEDAP